MNIRKDLLSIWAAVSAAVTLHGQYESELAAVVALGDLTTAPIMRLDDTTNTTTSVSAGETKGIYFDSVDYEGNETRVFAYLGIPAGASIENKVPAMVLVHGGGGSAFEDWVDKWTALGYAAISIDTEGQGPDGLTQHAMGGPDRSAIYADSGDPIGDQFMYHAVAGTILANSLMRSLPEVNQHQVGVMGISWGGVITSTAIGLDDRFALAIPVYGCGDMHNSANWWGSSLSSNQLYQQVWDPALRLDQAKMPTFWFSWPAENNFPLNNQAVSYRQAGGPRMVSLVPGMGHGHGLAWNRPESYEFADSIFSTGEVWCEQKLLSVSGTSVSVRFQTNAALTAASLITTPDLGVTTNRTWTETAISLTDLGEGLWLASGTLPANTTAWFINVTDGTHIASSGYQGESGGTDVSPYHRVNATGPWLNDDDASILAGDSIQFAPHPNAGGSWIWSGPNGFSSSFRTPNLPTLQLADAGEYIASYTDPDGTTSNKIFNVSVDALAEPFEAEAASITSGIIKNDTSANGGSYVDGEAGFNLTYTVDLDAGNYDLGFRIKVPSGNRSMGVYVNNVKVGTLSSSSTSWELATINANLNAGSQQIELRDTENTAELDVDSLNISGGNLAYGKVATQSSTNFAGVASRAVDGDTSGNWGGLSVTHTQNESNPWWEVELGSEYAIDDIVVWNRTDACCSNRLSDFVVSVINDHGQASFTEYFANTPNPSITVDALGSVGSRIRIELIGTNAVLSLAEVEVYGSPIKALIEPSADAYTRGGSYADTNFGLSTLLDIKESLSTTYTRNSFLKFPVGEATNAEQVNLVLNLSSLQSNAGTGDIIELRALSDDTWVETSITWNSQPASVGSLIESFPILSSDVGNDIVIDVTSYVTGEAAGDGVASFILVQPSGVDRHVRFNSRESANAPLLEVR